MYSDNLVRVSAYNLPLLLGGLAEFFHEWFDLIPVLIPQLANKSSEESANIRDDREGEGNTNHSKEETK